LISGKISEKKELEGVLDDLFEADAASLSRPPLFLPC
jgi:hypothetical protein